MLIDSFYQHIRNAHPEYNPGVILDIGSRDLDQSIEFNSVFPQAQIYAFEPNPEQFKICEEKATQYPSIKVVQKAISDAAGSLDFYVTHGNVGASSLLEPLDVPFASSQEVSKISVEAIRLDKWLAENNITQVDVMWLDTQGVELAALKGMGEFLKKVKFLHCEAAQVGYYKGHMLKDELEAFLHSMGFETSFHPVYHPYGEGDIIATNKNI